MAIVRLGNKDLAIASATAEQMPGGPMGMQGPYPPPGYVAGVTAPQYGMPISGTPIGLAGPPHVPLGVPAGLQQHTIVNHTRVSLPQPVTHERIDVQQEPGISYPEPVNHVRIVERTRAAATCRPERGHAAGTRPRRDSSLPAGTGSAAGQPLKLSVRIFTVRNANGLTVCRHDRLRMPVILTPLKLATMVHKLRC